MLFNSYAFIFAFLPSVIIVYYLVGRSNHSIAALWLAAASLFFYGWWDVRYVGLLLTSIVFNYSAGFLIGKQLVTNGKRAKPLLAACVVVNLAFLAYFKYANFFVDTINQVAADHINLSVASVVLPLGISFFTFTQIAFLVDTYQGKVKEFNFIRYTLFVTYFPHLIAGPVLHHAEMMPQFARRAVCRVDWGNVAVGLSIFVLGLAKKVLLADSIADFATPVFDGVKSGSQPMFFEAWVGALAYTLQLYLDFSAYSDMAIGLSLMFNVRLPLNFNSPYKATSIIEFWRRWHMTLSRFLRDYLYIPLGGGYVGGVRRHANLMITMLLGGLWHGAGWTFVIWGALHGFYLLVNHAWRSLTRHLGWSGGGRFAALSAGALTFVAVVFGWVFFRADSLPSAMTILQGMTGMGGVSLPASLKTQLGWMAAPHSWLVFDGLGPFDPLNAFGHLTVGFAIVWLTPNLHQIFQSYRPACEDLASDSPVLQVKSTAAWPWLSGMYGWSPSGRWAWLIGLLGAITLLNLNRVSEFLYFQF